MVNVANHIYRPWDKITGADMPGGNLADNQNFCRNPTNNKDGPWCYTTDPAQRWELCDVPNCSKYA